MYILLSFVGLGRSLPRFYSICFLIKNGLEKVGKWQKILAEKWHSLGALECQVFKEYLSIERLFKMRVVVMIILFSAVLKNSKPPIKN